MAITVKDLFQYDPNFAQAKIRRLTGKTNYKKSDTVDLSRLAALNDKGLSIFAAKKEGKTFINSIQDDNMRTQIAEAVHIKNEEKAQNNSNAVSSVIPMDKSIWDIERAKMA